MHRVVLIVAMFGAVSATSFAQQPTARLVDYHFSAEGIVLTFDDHPIFANYSYSVMSREPEVILDQAAHDAWQQAQNAWDAECELFGCSGNPPDHWDTHVSYPGGYSHASWSGGDWRWLEFQVLQPETCGYVDGFTSRQCRGGDYEDYGVFYDAVLFDTEPSTYTIALNTPGGEYTLHGSYVDEFGNTVSQSFSGMVGENVPEPSSLIVAAMGFGAFVAWRRRWPHGRRW